jgi:hypothetical protein
MKRHRCAQAGTRPRSFQPWPFVACAVLAVSALASCRESVRPQIGQPFDLHVMQAAKPRNSDLELFFRRVSSDSRCPEGAQCVTAGEAVLRFEGRIMKGAPESFDVTVPGGGTPAERVFDGYRIRVQRLTPTPHVNLSIDSTTYIATLLIEKR